ncbi:phenylacetate--CoA ligase family protein [Desulfuribacillus alkaliarsenatis]|uniref:Phenylacetate-coenzyme A ligase n=1 Tax=Desulfuribacillus alkaliarsenatis TaxID=766136 RepID=A0A1E5G4Y1_9FIRM|nr:phenylacetate--CoA ligase [Desulfuribacillus alkaliarsenatis]OEF98238.1 phenylacetate--CoA ligase [Desulfuribacillus alkaliarsenatis]
MIYNKEFGCTTPYDFHTLDRDSLEQIQLEHLQKTVARVYDKVPHYREAFNKLGITPADIKSLADVRKLPFTTKDALRDNYPFNLFAADLEDIVRIHASSGTTGKPTVVGYTKQDLDTWAEVVARIATNAGVTPKDRAQICFGYGLFTGGFGLHYGLERLGALIIPASVGQTKKQIMLMQDFKTTVLICTPTYALHLAEVAEEMGLDPRTDLSLRIGMFGSEPWTDDMRQEIEERLGIIATDNYGMSELIGPGVAGECTCKNGMHINEDHFLVEVIDPVTEEPVPLGEKGELVFTTLTKEGFPVIRYRTRDISRLIPEECECGRASLRMQKVMGRTDDMLKIRGVNVFPSQIESVLAGIPGTTTHYQIIVTRRGHLDAIEVQVEMDPNHFTGSYRDLEQLEKTVHDQIKTVLSVAAKVKLLEPKSLERTAGKAVRVIDRRHASAV